MEASKFVLSWLLFVPKGPVFLGNWFTFLIYTLVPVQQDSLAPDRFVDVINSLKKYTVSFLWDLIALAAAIYNKVCSLL